MILPPLSDHCSLGTLLHVKKEQRGVMATQTAAGTPQFAVEEMMSCSIEAMINGGKYKACQ